MATETITHKQYWAQIRSIVKDALREYKQHGTDTDPNEWLNDWLHQMIDGHEWIIYTQKNLFVLLWTDNQDAYFDDFGEMEATDFPSTTARLAYAAMAQDVTDNLNIEPFERAYEKAQG